MTTNEFSNEFDVLLNAQQQQFDGEYSSLQLDEYEKSVFLTQSEEEFVVAAYNGKNQYGFMFESDEESRRYLSSLVKTRELSPMESSSAYTALTSDSQMFEIPDIANLMFITYESVKLKSDTDECINGKVIEVVPVKQDEFNRVYDNPFRGPNDRRALRLDTTDNHIEIVCKHEIDKYLIRYVERPKPIILTNLDGGLAIRGETNEMTCLLDPTVHRMILQRAVTLALSSKSMNQRINQTNQNN